MLWVVGEFELDKIGKKNNNNKINLVQISQNINKSFILLDLILSRMSKDPYNPILKVEIKLYLILPIKTPLWGIQF